MAFAIHPVNDCAARVLTKNNISMKSLKEELIDFYVWCINNDIDHNIDIRIEKAVDKYLSINSEATVETPSVNDNEQKRKLCRKFENCKKLQCAKFNCKSNEHNKCYEA